MTAAQLPQRLSAQVIPLPSAAAVPVVQTSKLQGHSPANVIPGWKVRQHRRARRKYGSIALARAFAVAHLDALRANDLDEKAKRLRSTAASMMETANWGLGEAAMLEAQALAIRSAIVQRSRS